VASLTSNMANADLMAYWGFTNTDGGYVIEEVRGRYSKICGNPLPKDGPSGKALLFDGKIDRISIAEKPSLNCPTAITIAAWIKNTSVDKQPRTIIAKAPHGWAIQVCPNKGTTNTGVIQWQSVIGFEEVGYDIRKSVLGNTNVYDNKWHYIVAIHDGRRASLYVDGELEVVETLSVDLSKNATHICIGADPGRSGGAPWKGLIDDISIFSHALSESEIKQLYNKNGNILLSETMGVLGGAVGYAESLLDSDSPFEATRFITSKLSEHEQCRKKTPHKANKYHKSTLACLHFLRAKASSVMGMPKDNLIDAYKKSAMLSTEAQYYVQALLWLHKCIPNNEYTETIKLSLDSSTDTARHIQTIAGNFESTGDWSAFRSFLHAAFSHTNNPERLATSILKGLTRDGMWSSRFLEYAQKQPELRAFSIKAHLEQAHDKTAKGQFLQAAQIYRDLATLCDSDHGRADFQYRSYSCQFANGQYGEVVQTLNNFIKKRDMTDPTLANKARLLMGQAYMHLNKPDDALSTFLELQGVSSDESILRKAYFYAGYCQMIQGNAEQADRLLNKAIECSPNDAYANKARFCLRRIRLQLHKERYGWRKGFNTTSRM